MTRQYVDSKVIILSRTKMSGNNICVGAYDIENNLMLRLLSETARTLTTGSPYSIGEEYEIRYARKDGLHNPHTEDAAVYSSTKVEPATTDLNAITDALAFSAINVKQLFDGNLIQDGRSLCIPEPTSLGYSVQIAKLDQLLMADGDYYMVFGTNIRIKFVGFNYPGPRITSGTKIRFSLSRPWDKNSDGNPKSYLQLSGVYR